MTSTTKLCTASCYEIAGPSQLLKNLKPAFLSFISPYPSLPVAGKFAAFNRTPHTASYRSSALVSAGVRAFSTTVRHVQGSPSDESEASSENLVGANDMLIVGPGVLGRMVAEKWGKENPGCRIYGLTLTASHHGELVKLGIIPSLKGTQVCPIHKFPYVIFCAPPSRSPDYLGEVREATLSWNGEGSFLFTSSSAPYDCNDNGSCDENTPVVPLGKSPKTDTLLNVEKLVTDAGGCVVRLAGLYKEDRGAHTYWLKKGSAESRPDHILNLIHYEDAASLSVTILKNKFRSRFFLGCDNNPLSRQEVMELVVKSGKYSGKFEGFTGTSGPLGKKLNNSKTRADLGWETKYHSFAQFLES